MNGGGEQGGMGRAWNTPDVKVNAELVTRGTEKHIHVSLTGERQEKAKGRGVATYNRDIQANVPNERNWTTTQRK